LWCLRPVSRRDPPCGSRSPRSSPGRTNDAPYCSSGASDMVSGEWSIPTEWLTFCLTLTRQNSVLTNQSPFLCGEWHIQHRSWPDRNCHLRVNDCEQLS
jgi:hypothetical protein